jgi:hypothetical protein
MPRRTKLTLIYADGQHVPVLPRRARPPTTRQLVRRRLPDDPVAAQRLLIENHQALIAAMQCPRCGHVDATLQHGLMMLEKVLAMLIDADPDGDAA